MTQNVACHTWHRDRSPPSLSTEIISSKLSNKLNREKHELGRTDVVAHQCWCECGDGKSIHHHKVPNAIRAAVLLLHETDPKQYNLETMNADVSRTNADKNSMKLERMWMALAYAWLLSNTSCNVNDNI